MEARVFVGTPITVAIDADGVGGCGCMPHFEATASGDTLTAHLEACLCCEGPCGCVPEDEDEGYTGNAVLPAYETPGERQLVVAGAARLDLAVVERDQCHSATATGLEILAPTEVVNDGEQLYWARTTVRETLCCALPQPLVHVAASAGNHVELEAFSCVQDDCDCVGEPVETEVWTSLGAFPRGSTQQVTIGEQSAFFTVR